jgi:autotransporter translocation and assembly factor TamB
MVYDDHQTRQSDTPGTELTVTVSGGTVADARAVVQVLEPAFGSPREDLPASDDVTVHTARFAHDSRHGPSGSEQSAAGHLSGAVTLTVQGSPLAVATARETLAHAFTAQDQGSVSGDQEQELQLLLEP